MIILVFFFYLLYLIPVVINMFRLFRITDTHRCFSQRFEMTVIYDNRYVIYFVLANVSLM